MNNKRSDKLQAGAGMVEYALVLVLVAVGTIVILGLAGVGAQRLYGIVGGVLGAKKSESSGSIHGQVINITSANCYVIAVGSSYDGGLYAATGFTGYFLRVDTNVPLDQLNTAGTEQTLMMSVYAAQTTMVTPPGISNITFRMDSAHYPDASLCPRAAVVQSLQGSIAISPVEVDRIP